MSGCVFNAHQAFEVVPLSVGVFAFNVGYVCYEGARFPDHQRAMSSSGFHFGTTLQAFKHSGISTDGVVNSIPAESGQPGEASPEIVKTVKEKDDEIR